MEDTIANVVGFALFGIICYGIYRAVMKAKRESNPEFPAPPPGGGPDEPNPEDR